MASPTDITGLVDRWRADTVAQANGSAVSSWAALTGGAALTQATGAAQPSYQTGVIGGQPVVRFDGATDFMTATITAQNQPLTVSMVCKVNGGVGTLAEPIDGGGAQLLANGSSVWDGWGGTADITGGTVTTTSPAVVTFLANGASSQLWVGGVQVATGSPGTAGFSTTIEVGQWSGGGRFFNGDIAEIVVYSHALSTGELAILDTYYAGQYGVTLADAIPPAPAPHAAPNRARICASNFL